MNNDTDRLNWLEAQNVKAEGGGTCLFRRTKELGWRLMEMTERDAKAIANTDKVFTSVREAIDYSMEQEKTDKYTEHGKSPYDAGVGPLKKI